jgi:hypothetical protein
MNSNQHSAVSSQRLALVLKRAITLGTAAAVLVSAWLIYSKVVEMRRERVYHADLAQFQHALPVGMSKADVRKYLDSQKVNYSSVRHGRSDGDSYEIKIGEEPGDYLVCKAWKVYVDLEFGPREILEQVHIRKEGVCL